MQNVIIIIIFLPLHCHLSICSSVTIYSHISQRDFVDFRCCCCGRCWWCWRCFVVEFNAIVIAAAQTSHRTSRVPQPESSAPLSLSLSPYLSMYLSLRLFVYLTAPQSGMSTSIISIRSDNWEVPIDQILIIWCVSFFQTFHFLRLRPSFANASIKPRASNSAARCRRTN